MRRAQERLSRAEAIRKEDGAKRGVKICWGKGQELTLGGGTVAVFAGPCAVESRSQLLETAYAVKEAGAVGLRGGAYKPRTSPHSFQGLGERGLELLAEARDKTGLLVVTEATSTEELPLVAACADVVQIGSRNMQNFALLRAAGACGKPVVLKRGMAATVEEWLMAAEYILAGGNDRVILCERGIRTFEPLTRNTLDLGAVALLPGLTRLPVMADPSHAAGRRDLVPPLARAALAAGAEGLLIEVHPRPSEALCDGAQSLGLKDFAALMAELKELAAAQGRTLAALPPALPKGGL